MSDLLLVDDDKRIVELVGFFLRKRGHVVRVAGSFGAARTALAERMPELVLSDIDLGAERAEEELPRLAAEGILPPTLIVSGYLDPEMERRMLAITGVVGTLRKPYGLSVLEDRIEAALHMLHTAMLPTAAEAPSYDSPVDPDEGWIDIRAASAET
jgi:DNA-binding response OmpR family regulator